MFFSSNPAGSTGASLLTLCFGEWWLWHTPWNVGEWGKVTASPSWRRTAWNGR